MTHEHNNPHDMVELFAQCTDRLMAGESIDDILADYPDQAEELRALLTISMRVERAHLPAFDTAPAQVRGQERLLSQISQPVPAKSKRRPRWWRSWRGLAAAVSIVAGLGGGFLLGDSSLRTFRTFSVVTYSDVPLEIGLTGTAIIAEATRMVQGLMIMPTSLPPESGLFATATVIVAEATQLAASNIMITATPVAGLTVIQPTLMPEVVEQVIFPTPTPVRFRDEATLAAPPAQPPMELALTATAVAVFSTAPPTMPPPMMTATQAVGREGELPGWAVLQAGEIDDNAAWAEYLAYRDAFLASRHQNGIDRGQFIDIDITDRQIIRVTNAQGRPVMGAVILIFGPEQIELRTRADGTAYFFPNALPGTRDQVRFPTQITYAGLVRDYMLLRVGEHLIIIDGQE